MSRGGSSRTGGTGGSSGSRSGGSSSGGSGGGSSETAFATAGETLQEISSDADVARLARLVEATRVAKGHALNDRSSRSHCLVHVHVVQNVGGTVSKRQMLFVDLAGSERIARTGVTGERAAEAVGINSSLTSLGKVIKELGDGVRHVSYRDSVLTMLLKSSFGGRSATSVVINVAGDEEYADETICSLRFGSRMTKISNKATLVVGENARDAEAGALEALRAARHELAGMDAAGLGPRFDEGACASEVRSYLSNVEQLERMKAGCLRAREQLVEAKAQAEGGGGRSVARLGAQVEKLDFQASNMRDIVLRQKSIKGFVRDAGRGYQNLQGEIRRLEAQVTLLGGGGAGGRGGE